MVSLNVTALSEFSLAEAKSTILPLLLFVLGVTIYAVFIFKFYRFLAKRDIFKLQLSQYGENRGALSGFFSFILSIIEYLFIFPLFTFFWFAVISAILLVLGKNQDLSTILFIAMALVASIRVTSYYDEDLSKDLAKMMPFALLGVFLVDVTYFSVDSILQSMALLPSSWKIMAYYLAFAILLEFVLRIISLPFRGFRKLED